MQAHCYTTPCVSLAVISLAFICYYEKHTQLINNEVAFLFWKSTEYAIWDVTQVCSTDISTRQKEDAFPFSAPVLLMWFLKMKSSTSFSKWHAWSLQVSNWILKALAAVTNHWWSKFQYMPVAEMQNQFYNLKKWASHYHFFFLATLEATNLFCYKPLKVRFCILILMRYTQRDFDLFTTGSGCKLIFKWCWLTC